MRTFVGIEGRKMPPTKKHRPAIWEMMLGTVHAMNDEGEVKYFDYDWDAAIAFSGAQSKKDVRVSKCKNGLRIGDCYDTKNIRKGQTVLWVEKGE